MKHTYYQELLCLRACGELDADDLRTLEEHLAGCAECRAEQSQMMQIASVARTASVAVSDELLREARRELHAELLKLNAKKQRSIGVMDFIGEMFARFMKPAYGVGFVAIAMTAFGVLIGYALFSPSREAGQQALLQDTSNVRTAEQNAPPEDQALAKGATRAENIRILHADEANGIIEFVYESVTPVHVSGKMRDKNVQRVLARALVEEENPGVRLRAMDVIASQSGHDAGADAEIRPALLKALKTDENPAVRSQAVSALERFPIDAQVQKALVYALRHDKNPGVRIAAVNALASASVSGSRIDRDVLNDLRHTAQYDDNIFIRNQSRNVLQEASQL
jgi:hypothetical protein